MIYAYIILVLVLGWGGPLKQKNTIEFHNVSCNLKTLTDDIYDGNNYQKRDKNLKIQHFFMSRIKFFED